MTWDVAVQSTTQDEQLLFESTFSSYAGSIWKGLLFQQIVKVEVVGFILFFFFLTSSVLLEKKQKTKRKKQIWECKMCSLPSVYDFFISDDTGRIQSGQSHSDSQAICFSLTVEAEQELRGGVFPREEGRWALWRVKQGKGTKMLRILTIWRRSGCRIYHFLIVFESQVELLLTGQIIQIKLITVFVSRI